MRHKIPLFAGQRCCYTTIMAAFRGSACVDRVQARHAVDDQQLSTSQLPGSASCPEALVSLSEALLHGSVLRASLVHPKYGSIKLANVPLDDRAGCFPALDDNGGSSSRKSILPPNLQSHRLSDSSSSPSSPEARDHYSVPLGFFGVVGQPEHDAGE